MVKEVTASELEKIIKKATLVLVDFSAVWCGPCHRQHEILEELEQKLNGKIIIVSLDIDKDRAYAIQLGIRAVPTLQLYKNGQVVTVSDKKGEQDRLVSVQSLPFLENLINKFI